MIAQWVSTAQFFEAGMLICFGISWPMAIVKSLRTRRTEGMSLVFLWLVCIGYIAGTTSKFFEAAAESAPLKPVTALYVLNALMVAFEITLYYRYRPRAAKA